MAFLHSMTADSPIHGSAMLQMNTGRILSGSPCLGSWVNYGLGSVSENLPGFVVMLDPKGGPISGAKNWSSGYMPATYQGTILRSAGDPILDLNRPDGMTGAMQRRMLDTLREYNAEHEAPRVDNTNLAARIASYELAAKMQLHAPETVDLAKESEATKELYGMNDPKTEEFGRRCLLARRMVERGVRFIQLYSGGAHNDDNWDAHTDIEKNHNFHAGRTDKPIAGLLKDLKQRGLLDSTLIIWGGEFGRQPTAEYAKGTGRDHNAYGFTMWMAGGGVKGGQSIGETDELGSAAVRDKFHVKHLHATALTLMGLDPEKLSYFYGGLDQKLTGVEGADAIKALLCRAAAGEFLHCLRQRMRLRRLPVSGRGAPFSPAAFVHGRAGSDPWCSRARPSHRRRRRHPIFSNDLRSSISGRSGRKRNRPRHRDDKARRCRLRGLPADTRQGTPEARGRSGDWGSSPARRQPLSRNQIAAPRPPARHTGHT